MLLCNGVFLLYTAVIVPVQICMWNYDDPCNKFPTLYFDIGVDSFFMVAPAPPLRAPAPGPGPAPSHWHLFVHVMSRPRPPAPRPMPSLSHCSVAERRFRSLNLRQLCRDASVDCSDCRAAAAQ